MQPDNLVSKINELKGSIQSLWQRISANDFELARRKLDEYLPEKGGAQMPAGEDDERNRAEDLPLTIHRTDDDGEGVRYYATENSPLAAGAPKVQGPGGIDSFEEKDAIDPAEADENQGLRSRKQNSDLAQRYYSPGLDLDS
jgi:hypothetical protein